MRILSWNVNGLRAAEAKGFSRWLSRCGGDVVLLQEVRARPDQLPERLAAPRRWHAAWAPATRPGYSGVGILSREAPDEVRLGFGEPRFDDEGRTLMARFGDLCVLSCYFPNGGRDCSRIPYKLEYYAALLAHVEALRGRGLHVVVGGDWNTAHEEIDLARPRENREASGFRPEERAWVTRWVEAGWRDTFRTLHPDARDRYSWWAAFADARRKNVGWRIDYHFVDEDLLPRVREATIHDRVKGSDHCPVGVVVEA